MSMPNNIKIALVKQEIYQDLYVCPKEEKDPAKILFASQMRVGPIGLFSELHADYYIVKEEYAEETQIYRKVIPHIADDLQLLKTTTANNIPGRSFIQPGSESANGDFAVNCHDVDWGTYDIVISINISLPTNVVRKYPGTLFAYMIGEANMGTQKPLWGYDITLNQMARGRVTNTLGGSVDFPYTFLTGNSLETIMRKTLGRPSHKRGVFMEINSTEERPVTKVPPHFKILEENGIPVNLHKQKIKDNLTVLYDSKYHLKMGGRLIRGNAIAEAASLGVLSLADKKAVIHSELIFDEVHVRNMPEALERIQELDKNEKLYEALLQKQRKIVTALFFDRPLKSLLNCYTVKRAQNPL